ncbi:Nucleic acid-binding, OB-fold [Cynara cardunculus var. scolymus]|uniref:Nucleic acid-binding, OB-fold n=1 Tax=Cynara cardunculus var. scolymus TaxID=59895 RepID=A0A103YAH8_CYNCS|nr:Nucleic acid-binding, OB-fold [Cynara cardunculus var. scolymus]
MNGNCLQFDRNPIQDAISRIRFAPASNNLLISSWDSVTQNLRLYDVDTSQLVFEASSEAALLDCCFQGESAAFTAASDCSITRFVFLLLLFTYSYIEMFRCLLLNFNLRMTPCIEIFCRYDLHSGMSESFGNHDDLATCVEYSNETGQVITAGWDKKIKCWDSRSMMDLSCVHTVSVGIESMSLYGFVVMVAAGLSVNMYDLRKFNNSFYSKCVDIQINCVRPYLDQGGFIYYFNAGFAAGSVDGRVALKYFNPSNRNNDGYAFRCHPKAKEKRHELAAVNDIVFSPSIYGAFVTGNNDGYVTIWNAQSKKRVLEMPKFENSIASLSYNHGGQFLAVASSYTYQEANELNFVPIFQNMSDEEHQFESKADAGASKTFPQQAGTIRKNGYIVIKNRACKVVEVSTSKTGKHGHAKCHFVAIDIFNGKKLEDIVPSSHNCDVPHVTRTDYQLIDISEDGFIKDGFAEGKDLVVTVMSAMGEEQICALKDIGPK